MKENATGYFDDNNSPIFIGDILKSEYGYQVVVTKDEDGFLFGKLICRINHPCRNIPYALNKGEGFVKITPPQPLSC